MLKLLSIGLLVWLILFLVRVQQIGGLDPDFTEERAELFQEIRTSLATRIDGLLPYPQSALMTGILIGEQSHLPYFFKEDLQTTATIHMVVVSGQNLTILAGILMSSASWIGRKKAVTLTTISILTYILLTGAQIPVIRAGLMIGVTLAGQMIGKQVLGWIGLIITALIMLLYNPNWLFSISFQLSFLATVGVILVAPVLLQRLRRVPSVIREDLGVTISAQALVLPVIAANFNQISIIGVLANILILWTIPIVMVIGFIALVLSFVSFFVAQLVALVPAIFLTYFIYIVSFFADLPLASWEIKTLSPVVWVGYYLMIVGATWGMVLFNHAQIANKD